MLLIASMFQRNIIEKLIKWKSREGRKPLILNGVRQCGKTFILQKFAKENFRVCHTFNFETSLSLQSIFENTLEPKKIINALSLEINQKIDQDNDILFFDEIQACPKALNSLKYFHEKLPGLAVCAAGSLLGVRLSKEPFPVGKVDELHLFPLDFKEFLSAIGENLAAELLNDKSLEHESPPGFHEKMWEYWKHYLVVGGLPEVVRCYHENSEDLFTAFSTVREKQQLLISEYFKDMAKHSGAANALHLERVFKSVPAQLAKALDGSVSRYRFSGVVPGVSQYSRLATAFDWLEGAGLIHKVPIIESADLPLTQHVRENHFKVYIFDVGILGALGGILPKQLIDFDFGTYKGYVAENYMAQALKSAGVSSIYGWQDKTAEVEFVITDYNGVIPIEVKSGSVKQAKSLGIFTKRYRPEKAYIFGATVPRSDRLPHGTTVHRRAIYTAGR
jgi:predicted AAA+ superfamily ATPase